MITLGDYFLVYLSVGQLPTWCRIERLSAEIQALQTLSHPHLASYRHIWLEDERSGLKSP
jgi:hypothetical protein